MTDKQSKMTDKQSKMTDNKFNFSIQKLEDEKQKTDIPFQQTIIPKHPFRLLLSGQSGSGKTLCLLNLLLRPEFYLGFFKHIILISPNYDNDKNYEVLKKFILQEEIRARKDKKYKPVRLEHYEKYDKTEMDKLMNELSEAKTKLGDKMKPVLFILDDVIDDSKLINSAFFSLLATRSRHYNCSVMICTQSYKRVKRTTRLNMSHIILFKPSNHGERRRVYDEVIQDCNYKEFEGLCDYIYSKPYTFLVIHVSDCKKPLYLNFEYEIKRKNKFE
jgi:hypothetical protein